MSQVQFDVVGIGNAIVDVLAPAEDAFLLEHGIPKGAMVLVDETCADGLYKKMNSRVEMSGGSAANTMVGVARLGGAVGYIGKVSDDSFGSAFQRDISAAGVDFLASFALPGTATARCLIFVTPDANRTMNTYLGACLELEPADIEPDYIARAQVVYLEGYLWDPPAAKEAFRKALTIAHEHGRLAALTLSDAFCVDRHRREFLDLVENHIDILFANEEEIISLYRADNFDEALRQVRTCCQVVALTRGQRGSVVVSDDQVYAIEAMPISRLVDTTGAGDLYAAGFLYGATHSMDAARCGRLGALVAGEIISHMGARPKSDIAPLIQASEHPLVAAT